MSAIETQRQLLEELDSLEAAVSQRLRKNTALLPATKVVVTENVLQSKKRPHKETLLQQHELRYFGDQFEASCARASRNFEDKDSFKAEADALKDPEMKFTKFDQLFEVLSKKHAEYGPKTAESSLSMYAMYLSAPEEDKKTTNGKLKVKRRHVLSSAAAHLNSDLGIVFSALEMFGRFLDLSVFYDMYKVLTQSQDSYVQYLQKFDKFPYTNASGPSYERYLDGLLTYLTKFYQQTHPLETSEDMFKVETSDEALEDGTPNDKGEVFCKPCNKLFTKESVYKGHLDGKKHKKNAASPTANKAAPSAIAVFETRIKKLGELLGSIREATISDYERRSTLSEREIIMESLAVQGDESEYTGESSQNESSDEEDENFMNSLPLGTDGVPIPLWLYRLQGLHRSYQCEICGNFSYKGRQQFTKHFSQPKHIHGLLCLGVPEEEMPLFTNVSRIEEAVELWKKLKRSRRSEEADEENIVEVEDKDGNVMSHKDYVELKKQGLL